jgi:hypothetical protein
VSALSEGLLEALFQDSQGLGSCLVGEFEKERIGIVDTTREVIQEAERESLLLGVGLQPTGWSS